MNRSTAVDFQNRAAAVKQIHFAGRDMKPWDSGFVLPNSWQLDILRQTRAMRVFGFQPIQVVKREHIFTSLMLYFLCRIARPEKRSRSALPAV